MQLKKIALAVMMTLPAAGFAMESLDDSALSATTGRDGITLETQLNASIDRVMYTDGKIGAANNSFVSINGIKIDQTGTAATGTAVAANGKYDMRRNIDVVQVAGQDRLQITKFDSIMNVDIAGVTMGHWTGAADASAAGVLGNGVVEGGSLGAFTLSGISKAGTTQIWGHSGAGYKLGASGDYEVSADADAIKANDPNGQAGVLGTVLTSATNNTGIAIQTTGSLKVANVAYHDTDHDVAGQHLGTLNINNIAVTNNKASLMLIDAIVDTDGAGKLQITNAGSDMNITVGGIYIGGQYNATNNKVTIAANNTSAQIIGQGKGLLNADGTATAAAASLNPAFTADAAGGAALRGYFQATEKASLGAIALVGFKAAGTTLKISAH